MSVAHDVAKALLEIGAVKFNPENPWTYASGIISPIYVDNRTLPFYPETAWPIILEGFQKTIQKEKIEYDVVAGIAVGGVPHSATLGFLTKKPSVFIRKEKKAHGQTNMIGGGAVKGKKVLLIEDLVTTGGSSLKGVRALKEEGARVTDCLVIFTYKFQKSLDAFKEAGVKLHALTDFHSIVDEAERLGQFDKKAKKVILEWWENPQSWGK